MKNAEKPVNETSGRKFFEPLSKSELQSWLRLDSQALSRKIDLLVLHCSDTRPSQKYTIEMLQRDHAKRNFGAYPGYHFYIRRNGAIYYCRPITIRGCHVRHFNDNSLGICFEGGHSDTPPPYVDNRTAEQVSALHEVLSLLIELFPGARLVGHHDLNPGKACPCLDVQKEYGYLMRN